MSVFWSEFRKIWSLPIIAAIAVLGVMYYYLFPLFYIQHFENGPGAEAAFSLSLEWLEAYGPELDAGEIEEIRGRLETETALFDEFLSQVPGASEAGLKTLEDFRAYQEMAVEPDADLIGLVLDNPKLYTIQALEAAVRTYDIRQDADLVPPIYSEMQKERLLAEQEEPVSVLPAAVVVNNAREYFGDLSSWCVISVILLLSPTFVRDRVLRTRPLQWTSRTGRGIFAVQVRAGLLSALLLTAVNTVVYAVPFFALGPLRFADVSVAHAVFPAGDPWVSWTYGTFLAAQILLVFVCSMGSSALALFLSRIGANYVSMVLLELPLLVAGLLFAPWAADVLLYIQEPWVGAGFFMPFASEIAAASILVIASMIVTRVCAVRQRFAEC